MNTEARYKVAVHYVSREMPTARVECRSYEWGPDILTLYPVDKPGLMRCFVLRSVKEVEIQNLNWAEQPLE